MQTQKISNTNKILKKLLIYIVVLSTSEITHLLMTLTNKNFLMIYCTSSSDDSDQPLNLSKKDNSQTANNNIKLYTKLYHSDKPLNLSTRDNNQTMNHNKDKSTETYNFNLVNLKRNLNTNNKLLGLQHTLSQNFINQEASNSINDDFYARDKSSKRKKVSLPCDDCPNPKVIKLSNDINNEKKKIPTVTPHSKIIDSTKTLLKNINENIQENPQEDFNELAIATMSNKNDNIYKTSQSSSLYHGKYNWKRKVRHEYFATQSENQNIRYFQTINCKIDAKSKSISGDSIKVKLTQNKQPPVSNIIRKDRIQECKDASKTSTNIDMKKFLHDIAKKYVICDKNNLKNRNSLKSVEICEKIMDFHNKLNNDLQKNKQTGFKYFLSQIKINNDKYYIEESLNRLKEVINILKEKHKNMNLKKLQFSLMLVNGIILHSKYSMHKEIRKSGDFKKFFTCFFHPLILNQDKTSTYSYKHITDIYNLFEDFFICVKNLSYHTCETKSIDIIYELYIKNTPFYEEKLQFFSNESTSNDNNEKQDILETKLNDTLENIENFLNRVVKKKFLYIGFENFRINILNNIESYIKNKIEKDKFFIKIQESILVEYIKASFYCFKKSFLGSSEKKIFMDLSNFFEKLKISNKDEDNEKLKDFYKRKILTIINYLIEFYTDIYKFLIKVNKENKKNLKKTKNIKRSSRNMFNSTIDI